MPVITIASDADFQPRLNSGGVKLVVVDFTASWCGPCQMIAPVFEDLSNRFSAQAIFLKVDVDVCRTTAASRNVSSMPTFVFYRAGVELARIQGAVPGALENKIRELAAQTPDAGDESGVPGHMDLSGMMVEGSCECLNESDDHPLKNCLKSGSAFLESDCDEQLIINLTFTQAVKLHSVSVKGPSDKGPKNLRLFINQPRTLDFDQCSSMESVQDIVATKDDLEKGTPIPLRFVKFQNVLNLLIFVQDNQAGTETTVIEHLKIIGSPISTTNMNEFKRIAGKKDERH